MKDFVLLYLLCTVGHILRILSDQYDDNDGYSLAKMDIRIFDVYVKYLCDSIDPDDD